MGAGERLAATRARLGLTRARTAQLLGIAESTLAGCETGGKVPGRRVAARIRALEQLPTGSLYTRAPLMTAASTAAGVRRALREDPDGGWEWGIQLIAQALAHLGRLDNPVDRALYLAAPDGTGDRRWNVLLARATAWRCGELDVEAPAWTVIRALRDPWSPVPYPDLWGRLAATTPAELAEKNVLLDVASLHRH